MRGGDGLGMDKEGIEVMLSSIQNHPAMQAAMDGSLGGSIVVISLLAEVQAWLSVVGVIVGISIGLFRLFLMWKEYQNKK